MLTGSIELQSIAWRLGSTTIRSVRAIINGATIQWGMSSTLRRCRPCWDSATSMRFGTEGGELHRRMAEFQKLVAGQRLADVLVVLAHVVDTLGFTPLFLLP